MEAQDCEEDYTDDKRQIVTKKSKDDERHGR